VIGHGLGVLEQPAVIEIDGNTGGLSSLAGATNFGGRELPTHRKSKTALPEPNILGSRKA